MSGYSIGRLLLMVGLAAGIPACLLWLAYYRGISITEFLVWSLASWALFIANIWDNNVTKTKKAVAECLVASEMIEKGQFRMAEERLEVAGKLDPNSAEVYVTRGELYRNEQAWDLARRELLRAVELDANSFKAHFALGLNFLQEKKVLEAISEFRRTIVISPKFAEAHFILAQAYELAGERQKAVEAYRNFLKNTRPEDMVTKKMVDYSERAQARIRVLGS